MKSFRQYLNEFGMHAKQPTGSAFGSRPSHTEHPLHTVVNSMGFKHKGSFGGTHNYEHPTKHISIHLHSDGGFNAGAQKMSGAEHPTAQDVKKAVTAHHYTVHGKMDEDAPDSPYSVPANFNDPNAPKRTTVRKTPMPEGRRFLTVDEVRAIGRKAIEEGSVGKCPKCGSPNLSEKIAPDFESRKCIDCGKVSDKWRIKTEDLNGPSDHVDVNPTPRTQDKEFPRY